MNSTKDTKRDKVEPAGNSASCRSRCRAILHSTSHDQWLEEPQPRWKISALQNGYASSGRSQASLLGFVF